MQFLAGVGPRRAEVLARIGVETIGDLLEYFPSRHEREEASTIEHLDLGMTATIVGQVRKVRRRPGRRGPTVSATVQDNTGTCTLTWFNAAWMTDRLQQDAIVRATGKVSEYRDGPQLVNPRIEILGDDAEPVDESAPPRWVPVYPATTDLSSRQIARLIDRHLDTLLPLAEERYPAEFVRSRRLAPRDWSIRAMHHPTSETDTTAARRRLAYDELLEMQIVVQWARRRRREGPPAVSVRVDEKIDERIRGRFPFALTAGQSRAVADVVADFAGDRPMYRLVQGDVGCGKTVVALYAALAAVANRLQTALMAPTELLAQQHHRAIDRYLRGSRVRHALLVGGLPASRRDEIRRRLAGGELDIVVGTHALIQDDVHFKKLGLVIVDEQHRFGVRQRAAIRGKGASPHYLIMSATPIPRTLCMTIFGDLDVSTIEEMPPGRGPISTRVVIGDRRQTEWEFVRGRLRQGERAFVVYPLVDESDRVALSAATTEYERLQREVFADWTVGLIHGRLGADERERAMQAFADGRTQVLVATTVIEVGIDVPEATCMVIEHADRFGLSQLHQLRGRVGRGSRGGYCLLMTDAADGAEHERLAALLRTTDGFEIAEEDLRLRGPGAITGTQQHGVPELRVANLISDGDLVRLAQRDAADILRDDPRLAGPIRAPLRRSIARRYRDAAALIRAG